MAAPGVSREHLAEVLYRHVSGDYRTDEDFRTFVQCPICGDRVDVEECAGDLDLGYARHLADVIRAAGAVRDDAERSNALLNEAEVRAETLRLAADDYEEFGSDDESVASWLRQRAAAIRAGEQS